MVTASPALHVEALAKHYGALAAVDGITFDVRAGEVFGLLGPNGCGKSTTLNMVLGLVRPTSGRLTINGHPLAAERQAALASIGGLVEGAALYPYLSGRENLALLARLRGLPAGRVEEALAQVEMTYAAERSFGDYSQGMKQRLGVAAALLHRPTIVVLDEPTSGLDPAGTRDMRALIPALAREGRAVVLTSHLLNEVEQTCDRLAIMQRGRIIAEGPVETLLGGTVTLVVVPPPDTETALAALRAVPGALRVTPSEAGLRVEGTVDGAILNHALVDAGIYASTIQPDTRSLESVFLDLTGGAAGTMQ
ncbi:MAG: ABC transporter ATP-binding protein [Dehalococcoidia bacterium]|nr:ABC transporter ATP-binding protein [Dehalococcoidia bacterium]